MPNNVEVVTKLGEGLPQIMADAEQLQQVFLNLIDNAIQAMPQGGKLSVHTSQGDNIARVEFKDTGVGITPESMPKIFQPFFTTKARGAGLGLAIVKSIVESHHGNVEVKSEVGKGTTFIITLPKEGNDESTQYFGGGRRPRYLPDLV